MGKGKLPWRTVVLMEVQWGFAFFDVATNIFCMPVNMIWAHFTNPKATHRAVYFLDLIKTGDKSALWCSDNGCGESFVDLVKEYSSRARRFIVEDEKLRTLIKSKLGIDSFKEKEDVVREVVWGLRAGLPFIISEFKYSVTISPQCHLPLCQGFKVLMKKYQIVIPTEEAVDRDFLTCAGTLQRLEELRLCCCVEMRKACVKLELVPGISGMIKDYFRYFEVMAKILSPGLVDEEWDSSKWTTAGEPWFTPDQMQKIDAAAGDARKKVEGDHKLAAMIKESLLDYRCFSKSKEECLQKLRSYEAKKLRSYEAKAKRGQKGSHTEMAEEEVVEAAAEGRKGEDGADVTEEK